MLWQIEFFGAMSKATLVLVGPQATGVESCLFCSWAWLLEKKVLFDFVHWWQDQNKAAGALQMARACLGSDMKLCLWLPWKTMVFFCPFSPAGFAQEPPYLRTQNLCSLQLFNHTSSLSLSIFSSILLERPSIWTMNYSVYFLLTTLLQFSMKTQQLTVASGFDLTHAIS